MNQVTTDRLMQDVRVVVGDAEELLKATAAQTGEKVQQLRARTEESLRVVRTRLDAASQDMDLVAREAARQVDARVREHPWTAIGVTAGVALIAGFLLGRK